MTITNRTDYENALQAIGICVSTRIPVLLWGNPGEGKTSMIESAAQRGWHIETVIISQSEPSDLAGLPVVGPRGGVTLAPPAWAKRLAETDGPTICFFDEFSTAQPSLQAAALRILTHSEVGSLTLPESVAFVAAANPIDVAAAGWELAAPTASRFIHLDFGMPLDVFSDGVVAGSWPTLPVYDLPPCFSALHAAEMALITGFLRIRESQLSVVPKDASARGRAFPTPRTWDYAGALVALADVVNASHDVVRLLVAGAVGDATAHEYLSWRSNVDLPDPDCLLNDVELVDFSALRPDRVYVVLQSVLAALQRESSSNRWAAAVELCCQAAGQVGIDAAVPAVRTLLRPEYRPHGASVPSGVSVFAPALSLAGLIP
ncbi:AAA family ATPase [Mycolicibacter longobardus]|uniref:AAA family ATPase n=1 Tax=Mycolicibacter longobardus TaxID=1108812 RepID=UPI0021F392D3|nr:AAA family ATPase [Mycolicibacter longobardus]MCV7384459.1 AAA family ATPase [Mycolicibacter longobardus]